MREIHIKEIKLEVQPITMLQNFSFNLGGTEVDSLGDIEANLINLNLKKDGKR